MTIQSLSTSSWCWLWCNSNGLNINLAPKSGKIKSSSTTLFIVLMMMMMIYSCSVFSNGQTINAFTEWEIDNLVKLHNDYRFDPTLTPPALDMNVMEWNDSLANVAAQFVDKCTFAHNTDRPLGSGENIYISLVLGMSLGSDATKAWAAEKAYYTLESGCQSGKTCYHYTQMIWSNTSKLGCARKKCSSIQGLDSTFNGATMMVCNYDITYDTTSPPYFSKSYLTRDEATLYTNTILTNVKTIPMKYSSYFFPHGSNAFPLLISDNKVIAMAASYYRMGRVCAFGHESYLHHTDTNTAGDLTLLIQNCIKWTTNQKTNITYMLHGFSNSFIYSSLNGMKFSSASNAFDELTNPLDSVDLLVLNLQSITTVSNEMIQRIKSFLKRGGGILTGVTGWAHSLSSQSNLFAGNLFFSEFGLTFYNGYFAYDTVKSVTSITSPSVTLTTAETFNPYWSFYDIDQKSFTNIVTVADVKSIVQTNLNEISNSFKSQHITRSLQTIILMNNIYIKNCKSITIPIKITTDIQKKCTFMIHALNMYNLLPIDNNQQVLNGENYPGIALNGDNYRNASIISDSVTISTFRTRWHCSGYYALPGSIITISITNTSNINGISLVIGGNSDDISGKAEWPRWPILILRKSINSVTKSTGTFISYSGGIIYFDISTIPLTFTATISGQIVKVPYFNKDLHSNLEWMNTIRYYPAPKIEIEGTHFIFSVKNSAYARSVTDMQAVAEYWGDGVMNLYYDLLSMEPRDYKERFQTDLEISMGYMHSGYPIMAYFDLRKIFLQHYWAFY